MTGAPSGHDPDAWKLVDEGWGRRAAEFATLSEPGNAREYVALQHRLDIGDGDRVLDLACGSGLAMELATLRGATVAGIDAASRLVAVARQRLPEADIRVGDMHALPWEDGSFDVVTSFRGIWGTTPDALAEARRVLVPGGRLGFTVWGHIKKSPGAWALSPLRLASEAKVENQAAMVALGRPGVGEELLARYGFEDVQRLVVPFIWEFPDAESYARALATTGPAYEAIQAVGEEEFVRWATEMAREHVVEGLLLRAEVDVVGYLARAPERDDGAWPHDSRSGGFLPAPAHTPAARRLYDEDVEELGYVMNGSRVWGHLPEAQDGLFELLASTARAAGLTLRERGVLVTAMASTLGDSYCALAWGTKLAEVAEPGLAGAVLSGDDEGLTPRERALARWARSVTRDPNATTGDDVEQLRAAGFDDGQVIALTLYVGLRIAFATVNDSLGTIPDPEMIAAAPDEVRSAVTWGRPPVQGGDMSQQEPGAAIDRLLAAARKGVDRVAAEDLEAELAAGALVVDIRPVEQRTRDGELPGALVVPRNVLEWRLDPSSPHRLPEADARRRVIVVCDEGYSSSLAAATLRQLGVEDATDLAGGVQALLALRPRSGD